MSKPSMLRSLLQTPPTTVQPLDTIQVIGKQNQSLTILSYIKVQTKVPGRFLYHDLNNSRYFLAALSFGLYSVDTHVRSLNSTREFVK